MRTDVIHACITGSLDGSLTFPESVQRLAAIGIERYYADLVRMETVFYGSDGQTAIERLTVQDVPAIAGGFNEDGVRETVKTIQRKMIDYPEFLRRIMAHGSTGYTIFIGGEHAVYHGRKGENYVERFPQTPTT